MNSISLFSVLTIATVALACTKAESQSGVRLETRLPVSFGMLSNVVELRDGRRIVFTDTQDRLFLRADLNSGRVDTLGRRVDTLPASGPVSQYKFPGWVAHLAGDTIALVDFSAVRTTLWDDRGQPLRLLSIRKVSGDSPVLLYDTVGYGYKVDYQAVLGSREPGRAHKWDSLPVLRIGLASGTVDTVAMLAAPEYGDATFGEQVQQATKVFAPNDHFGVLPDGTIWVARGHENRVDWRSTSGTWTLGKPREYARVPVTQMDRDRVVAQVRRQGKQFGMPQNLPIVYPFADTKPPFEVAMGRPNGEVWLQRPRSQENAALVYDVVDRKGVWQREVTLPAGATLAGFGVNGAVYASIKGEDGRRTVGRFRVR